MALFQTIRVHSEADRLTALTPINKSDASLLNFTQNVPLVKAPIRLPTLNFQPLNRVRLSNANRNCIPHPNNSPMIQNYTPRSSSVHNPYHIQNRTNVNANNLYIQNNYRESAIRERYDYQNSQPKQFVNHLNTPPPPPPSMKIQKDFRIPPPPPPMYDFSNQRGGTEYPTYTPNKPHQVNLKNFIINNNNSNGKSKALGII